ncbi:MAG: hypothetical protein AB1633_10125, partial [Elusimicrobiota bacterium]
MQKLSPKLESAVKSFIDNPSDSRVKQQLNTCFWDMIFSIVHGELEKGHEEVLEFDNSRYLFDYGFVASELLENGEKDFKEIFESEKPVADENIICFSQWVALQYKRIINFNKREQYKQDILIMQQEASRKRKDIEKLCNERETFFSETIQNLLNEKHTFSLQVFNQYMSRFEKIKILDSLYWEISVIQNSIREGKFLDVNKKREFVSKKKEYDRNFSAFDNFITELRNQADIQHMRELCESVNILIDEIIASESKEQKLKKELESLNNEWLTLSPMEIKSRVDEMLDYFKGLMILSSKRVRATPFSVLTGKFRPTMKWQIKELLNRIEEYDPKVFRNERVSYMGPPKIVVIPGYGNGIYDWKNNAMLIPSIPYSKLEDSLYMAIVEYKLDMDEDKLLLTSYNKIEDYKGIRSFFALKERFAKDYAIYMAFETRGYKVLEKSVRDWFLHEIAPSRNEIKLPMKYDFSVSTREVFDKMKLELKQREKDKTASDEDYYGLAMIFSQEDDLDTGIEYLCKTI